MREIRQGRRTSWRGLRRRRRRCRNAAVRELDRIVALEVPVDRPAAGGDLVVDGEMRSIVRIRLPGEEADGAEGILRQPDEADLIDAKALRGGDKRAGT